MRSRLQDEDGVTAVIVVLSVFMLLAAGMVAVDMGMVWETKRDLIPGTDSAALAAASYLNENPGECATAEAEGSGARTQALELLADNQGGDASLESFEVSGCGSQIVKTAVTARQDATQFLSDALGFSPVSVPSLSVAQAGPVVAMEGLLPIGLCVHDPAVSYYVFGGAAPPPSSIVTALYPAPLAEGNIVYRIGVNDGQSHCGTSLPGNWGWATFDDPTAGTGNCSNDDTLVYWICNGYPETVDLGDPDAALDPGDPVPADADEVCAPSDPDEELCHARTGAINSAIMELDSRWACGPTTPTASCKSFTVILYDYGEDNGTNARYHPYAFLSLVLRDSVKVGSDWYMDIQFVNKQVQGRIGLVDRDTGTRGVRVCSVDGDPDPSRCDG